MMKQQQHHHHLQTLVLITTTLLLSLSTTTSPQPINATCPLDFSILRSVITTNISTSLSMDKCQYIRQGLRLVESRYLQLTNSFLPPLSSAESCWSSYQSLVDSFLPNFTEIRSSCGFNTSWISQGCANVSTRSDFEALVPRSALNDVVSSCNQSLENNSPCAACTTSLSRVQALYLNGVSVGNLTDCRAYPAVYAAAFANVYGPTDRGTAQCLFLLNFASQNNAGGGSTRKRKKILALVVSVFLVVIGGGWWWWWWFRRRRRNRDRVLLEKRGRVGGVEAGSVALESIKESTTLVKFGFDEIKKATRNFHRENIIGRGGYGNVYRGELEDGSEVAVKRFKNCSVAGDANFAHEVEVIASVRHVNLVALRGYCITTTQTEGHQRIILCDLMKNGSLYDHLLGPSPEKLSWPIRQKIAVGTARGLAYLHFGAQPTIIHRDIKASNILLDEKFEPKVADFGLAKFAPEGVTHMSTRVAGTMGYVAPEYALYGQLSERSDVYSFGVVLLELLSGKKAIVTSTEDYQPFVVTDWAWSLVRKGKALDIIDPDMPELGAQDVLEKYVLVAVLCSHPQSLARPTMDQVVKMLETDLSIPNIPERPIPIVAEMDDIERSVSSSGSGQLSSSTGYQPFTFEDERPSAHNGLGSSSYSRT